MRLIFKIILTAIFLQNLIFGIGTQFLSIPQNATELVIGINPVIINKATKPVLSASYGDTYRYGDRCHLADSILLELFPCPVFLPLSHPRFNPHELLEGFGTYYDRNDGSHYILCESEGISPCPTFDFVHRGVRQIPSG